jgi:hypothetical protein
MPYIKVTRRAMLDDCVELMEDRIYDFEKDPGELTYILYRYGKTLRPSFKVYALFVGSIILCLWEFFRRVIGKYEDSKCRINGDVK